MKRVAIIGAGVSGLTVANLLKNRYSVTVFEKEFTPGGLIRCNRVNGNLFHLCGGHVFNSKRQDVLDWFWSKFDKDSEFVKAERYSVICRKGNEIIPYPIENHIYMLEKNLQYDCIQDFLSVVKSPKDEPSNFEDFLRFRFGDTLFNEYFRPYNEKIWRRDLKQVPLDWLEGKLPKPTIHEILLNNINHIEEKSFVHSSFWYEKSGGSQFIADRLAEGLDVKYGKTVQSISRVNKKWVVCNEFYDIVFFCGNVKDLPGMLSFDDIIPYTASIESLEYHGTTSVLCEIENNPYSWVYLPDSLYDSHRIICTGNFSTTNNAGVKKTGIVEFTDKIDMARIVNNLSKMPFCPKYLSHHYSKYSYPIQSTDTRQMIFSLKSVLSKSGFYLSGRFADWEYYNMDAAMGAAMDLCKQL